MDGLAALKIHIAFLTQILYFYQYNSGTTLIKCMKTEFGKALGR